MEIRKTTVGALAAFSVIAGAGGAYLALRSNEPAPAAAGAEVPVVSPAPSASVAEESAAIVNDDVARPVGRTPPSALAERRPVVPPPPAVSRELQAQVTSVPSESAPELDRLPLPTVNLEVQSVAPPALEPVRPSEPEPFRTVDLPSPEFEELVVPADSVVGLQVENTVTSEGARVEDEVVARVTRDCVVDGRVVIPAGAQARGEVTLVERGGRLRDRARLGVRFTSIVLADGTRIPFETETIYREGDAPGGESAARIGGGAFAGAILGGIFGGSKGAAIGGSAGAGAGTVAVLAGGPNPATLVRGTPITIRITAPMTVTLEKE